MQSLSHGLRFAGFSGALVHPSADTISSARKTPSGIFGIA
nr:hypothetical protein Hi04_10k_c1000_00005 [uncultured bacterium]